MAASDYSILVGLFNLYLAKKLKGNKMSEDRRVITDSEILGMTEWYLRKELRKIKKKDPDASNTIEISDASGKPIFQLTLLDDKATDAHHGNS